MNIQEANKGMTLEEANKLIAEYIGYEIHATHIYTGDVIQYRKNGEYIGSLHYLSLDALIPVWEKLDIEFQQSFPQSYPNVRFKLSKHTAHEDRLTKWVGEGKTVQEAACIATAKAILELNSNRSIGNTKGAGELGNE